MKQEPKWDYEADVVVCGSGAMGMPACIRARDAGVSVLVVEANWDVGGAAINSGGWVNLGGGTSAQIAAGVVDSPDLMFKDMTDWSIMSDAGISEFRYVDRQLARAFADNSVGCYNFLVANGVVFPDPPIASHLAGGISAPRRQQPFMPGMEVQGAKFPSGSAGGALIRSLEESARAKEVQFLLNYHMDNIFREETFSGRALGISASYSPTFHPKTGDRMESYYSRGNIEETKPNINIKAKRAVIIATGTYAGNVEFRRTYDQSETEEVQLSAIPYARRLGDGSGLLAAMDIGASLWANKMGYEHSQVLIKPTRIGLQHSYQALTPASISFPWARAIGLSMGDRDNMTDNWQNVICVNQVGNRFYDETAGQYARKPTFGYLPPGVTKISQYVHGNWRNTQITYKQSLWVAAARQMNEFSTPPDYAAGPVWAIFDADTVTRMKWTIGYPYTDEPDYFFRGNTIAELAQNIKGPYTKRPIQVANLEATITRYNSFVDTGVDIDFDKPKPKFKIQTPPFYAAWATPMHHDGYNGLRANGNWQVIDRRGKVIPNLYAGGETVGGLEGHGLFLGINAGYIAGGHAAKQTPW